MYKHADTDANSGRIESSFCLYEFLKMDAVFQYATCFS